MLRAFLLDYSVGRAGDVDLFGVGGRELSEVKLTVSQRKRI